MQHLYRSDRAGAQDHLAPGAGLSGFASLNEAHPGGASVLDDQAIHQHVFLELKIGAPQRGLQKTSRRRPSASALLVDVEIADALIVAGIEIRNLSHPHFFGRIGDRIKNFPGQPRRFDPPAAARAMMLAFAQKMILQPPERRPDVVPAPAAKAELAPVVVIGGLAAHQIMALMADEPPITLPRG